MESEIFIIHSLITSASFNNPLDSLGEIIAIYLVYIYNLNKPPFKIHRIYICRKYLIISFPVTLYVTYTEYNLSGYKYKYVNFLQPLPVGIFLGLLWSLYLPYAVLEKANEINN